MDINEHNNEEGFVIVNQKNIDNEKFSMMLSSCHINFLFGSGVNGKAFPQMSGFIKTNDFLKRELDLPDDYNFEEALDLLDNDEKREGTKNIFKDEFNDYVNNINYKHASIINIEDLIKSIYALISKSENRTADMNQVHIFTLNYDYIVENVIKNLGYSLNSIKPSDISIKSSLFNYVSYDYTIKKYVPTYIVSKLHGDIQCSILPGKEKYIDTLNENHFELFFMMKSQLIKRNSVLFVIGYSGGDKHVNKIIDECCDKGLLVYFIDFNKKDDIDTIGLNSFRYLYANDKPSRSNIDSTKFLNNIFKNTINHDK